MGNRRLYALGRKKQGEMNKTEAAYDRYLDLLKHAGEVLWYKFEGIKLRLADGTFLTIDFAVLGKSGLLELHDVKGSKAVFQEDARAKMKIAADMYPLVIKAVYPASRKFDSWEVEEF